MNDDLLIQLYLDGKLNAENLAVLQRRLREDGALREQLRTIAEQAVAFGDLAQPAPGVRGSFPREVSSNTRGIAMSWLALAASLTVLAASAWLFLSGRPSPVLTLLESTGTVAWSDGTQISIGDHLTAGTLETVGEGCSAPFRFADGTLLVLHGEAELTFSEDGQKILALSRGTLSAQVKPQPSGRPMIVRTPSAVAEVVGTAFDLTARSNDTLLKVTEGSVTLKRLADGSQVDVAAQRSAVASLQTDTPLAANVTPEPLTDWSFDFTTETPPRDWRGYAKDGLMHASPYVAKKHADGRVTTHFGVSIRTAMLPQPLRLQMIDGSVIRYRLRQAGPGPLQVMLLTNRLEGGFGGNFECQLGAEDLEPGADGWCDLEIPVHRFHPVDPRPHMRNRHPTPSGNILTSAIISTFNDDRGLTVERFEFRSRP